jgi:hypothetical protein
MTLVTPIEAVLFRPATQDVNESKREKVFVNFGMPNVVSVDVYQV